MAERDNLHDGDKPVRPTRVDRHRIAREAAEAAAAAKAAEAAAAAAPAPPAPAAPAAPVAPGAPAAAVAPAAPVARPRPAFGRPAAAPPKDKTRSAVRRPALLSDRCVGCGAKTKDVTGMVTELVEVGPIRTLRVVACSACPDRRRRGLTSL